MAFEYARIYSISTSSEYSAGIDTFSGVEYAPPDGIEDLLSDNFKVNQNIYIEGPLWDKLSSKGTLGQVLLSDGNGVYWGNTSGIGTPLQTIGLYDESQVKGVVANLNFIDGVDPNNLVQAKIGVNTSFAEIYISDRWSANTVGVETNIYRLSKVGVGTTNPTQELDVNGDVRIRGAIYDANNSIGISSYVLSSTGVGITWTPPGIVVQNIVYVTQDGNDSNTGRKLGDAKRTIGAALSTATTGTTIKVSAGSYIENNPLIVPEQVSIIGDSLREVSVSPLNADKDLFYVSNGDYVAEMSYTGTLNGGKAVFAFNPNQVGFISQSPYIQNCTNFIPNSIGLKVDGSKAIGPIKSMVLDSYTQYNQGGIGVSITNEGYAQLVSLFTICNEISVFCGSGGACDLTNSNSSFGNYALVADGIGPLKYTGIITTSASANSFEFTLNLNVPTLNITSAKYDNKSGILTATTNIPHKFSVGMGVTIVGLAFTCPSGPGIVTYPSGNKGYIFETVTVAPGRYVDSYNLIQANRQEIIDTAYSGIALAYPGFVNPSPDKCKRDIGYIVDSVSLDVRDFTSKNSIQATKAYFNYSGTNLISEISNEIPQTIVGFTSARDLMKLAITNNLSYKDLTIAADPVTNSNTDPASCSDVRNFIDNLVGIITTRLYYESITGAYALPSVSMASTTFSVYVGNSTLPHTYNSGGTVKIDVSRPFDGQVVYFDRLYYTIGSVGIASGGSGYTGNAEVTVSSPEPSWGIPATAVAQIKDGSVISVDMISNGRGYTTEPKVTFSSPNVGINTATGKANLVPTYYSILQSTPISSGICTITINDNVPYSVGLGTEVPFFKQSRVLASGHSLEYIGSGTNIASAVPKSGGVPIQENETDSRNGGLIVFTTTDQSGNFRIGDGVVINQQNGTISGTFYSRSLFSTMTPFILALGGE